MYSLESFNNQAILLAKSLVIKIKDVAITINRGLKEQHGENYKIPVDKTKWKYYMNLAGIKHETNSNVLVNILELGEWQPLTKDILDKYLYTKSELLKNGEIYNNLIDTYPKDITYIHGCLYPVDIKKAIEADDGTILAYNKNHLEENEYNMVKDLQSYIQNFLKRWHVREYMISDELYLPAMLGVLYSNLPLKINNLRLERVHTNEAHSFHIEHYLRSNLNIWEQIELVDNNTRYWIYKNIKWLMNNMGTQRAFEVIIEKLLTPNFVGIGSYNLRKPNVELNETKGTFEPVYKHKELVINKEKLNPYFTDGSKSATDIETLVQKQLNLDERLLTEHEKNQQQFTVEKVKEKVAKTIRDNQKTKTIEIATYQLFKKNGVDLFKLLVDHVLYFNKNKKLNYIVDFIEPNDNSNYILSVDGAILMLLKMVLVLNGQENVKLKKYTIDSVLVPSKEAIQKMYNLCWRDGYIEYYFKELEDNYPNLTVSSNSQQELGNLINKVRKFYEFCWTLDSNLESILSSANMKQILNHIVVREDIILTDKEEGLTIDELLAEKGYRYRVGTSFDLNKSIQELLIKLTNISLEEFAVIRRLTEGFKTLIKKLCSYSIQPISADSGENLIYLYYTNSNILTTKYPIVTVTSGNIKPLDYTHVMNFTIANKFKDYGTDVSFNNRTVNAAITPKDPVKFYFYRSKDVDIAMVDPTFQVEVLPEHYVGINRGVYKNEFISNIEIDVLPIEQNETNVKVSAINNNDGYVINVGDTHLDINAMSRNQKEYPITLEVERLNKEGDISRPTYHVEIVDDAQIPINTIDYKEKFFKDIEIELLALEENLVKMDITEFKEGVVSANATDTPKMINSQIVDNTIISINTYANSKDTIEFTEPTVSVQVR